MIIDNLRIYDFGVLKNSLPIQNVNVTSFKLPQFEEKMQVKNQIPYDCCVACAITSALEYFNLIKTGEYREFSVAYVYAKHRKETSWARGMPMPSTISYLLDLGTVPITMFGQMAEMPDIKKMVNKRPDLDVYAKDYKIGGFAQINQGVLEQREEFFKLALLNGFPIIADYGSSSSSHAIIVYGFEYENGTLYGLLQNSMGTNVGNKGRERLPMTSLRNMVALMDHKVTLPFKDVPEDAWFYKNILNMFASGYVNGKTDTEFCPNDSITRAEVCAILDRVLKREDGIRESSLISIDERLKRIEEKIGIL